MGGVERGVSCFAPHAGLAPTPHRLRSEDIRDSEIRRERRARRVRGALRIDLLAVHQEVGDLAARGIPADLDDHLVGEHVERGGLGADRRRRLDVFSSFDEPS
jgi:hypothetical protein